MFFEEVHFANVYVAKYVEKYLSQNLGFNKIYIDLPAVDQRKTLLNLIKYKKTWKRKESILLETDKLKEKLHEKSSGGKGANLAEMNLIGVPVPPGFTITTEVCNEYFEKEKTQWLRC